MSTRPMSPFAIRYRTDSAFRALIVARQAGYRKARAGDKRRMRLQYLHRRVFDLRASVQYHTERLESKEKELLRAVKERGKLQDQIPGARARKRKQAGSV